MPVQTPPRGNALPYSAKTTAILLKRVLFHGRGLAVEQDPLFVKITKFLAEYGCVAPWVRYLCYWSPNVQYVVHTVHLLFSSLFRLGEKLVAPLITVLYIDRTNERHNRGKKT
jgi:hypothetical protein